MTCATLNYPSWPRPGATHKSAPMRPTSPSSINRARLRCVKHTAPPPHRPHLTYILQPSSLAQRSRGDHTAPERTSSAHGSTLWDRRKWACYGIKTKTTAHQWSWVPHKPKMGHTLMVRLKDSLTLAHLMSRLWVCVCVKHNRIQKKKLMQIAGSFTCECQLVFIKSRLLVKFQTDFEGQCFCQQTETKRD